MEFASSDLRKTLNKVPKYVNLKMDHILKIFYNILCSINFIHTSGIMHRDIKPANILINSDCSVRICDFGLARTYDLPDPIQKAVFKSEIFDRSDFPMQNNFTQEVRSNSPIKSPLKSTNATAKQVSFPFQSIQYEPRKSFNKIPTRMINLNPF